MFQSNALERIQQAKETNATKLDLSGLDLKKIPQEIQKLTELKELDLSHNQISKIENLDTLINLTTFDLENNQISKIENLDTLAKLTTLDLETNSISKIENLDALYKLTTLNLYNNQISKIENLYALTNITELNLSDNNISKIENLGSLFFLKKLDLTDNPLTEIPEPLMDLDLEIIWSSNNSDRRLDSTGIYVRSPMFVNPPPKIIKEGNKAILEYFDQRRKTGEVLLQEAKLILLGDGRAGKTSLVRRLLHKELPTEADRTQGVDIMIGEYRFPLPNGDSFKINIWDFAGQDKYKTLHQLFYTESSLYVMVAESGNAGTDYDDWFQTADLFGEGSPLLLVLNEFKTGIGMGSFDTIYWKKQFPNF